MKARGKNTVYALTLLMIVYLLLPTCMAYAAGATAPKSAQPAQPVGIMPSTVLPNAPPQGSITITTPQTGTTWYTSTYQYIKWTCNGTRSNLVDVTLWQNNQQIATIGTGVATGQTAYTVPATMAAGSYEVRVTMEEDTRVEARRPVGISYGSITVTAPMKNEVLNMTQNYTIRWTYQGNITRFAVIYTDSQGCYQLIEDSAYPSGGPKIVFADGNGSLVWYVRSLCPTVASSAQIQVVTFLNGVASISANSANFSMTCAKSNCYGNCTDLKSDVLNCGWCGHNCTDVGATACNNGQCSCSAGAAFCPGQPVQGGYACVDLSSNNNCGSCGAKCNSPKPDCLNGVCVCRPPKVTCFNPAVSWTSCSDLQTDGNNCGQCGNKCPYSQPWCYNGNCQANQPNQPPDLQNVLPSPLSQ